MEAFIEAVREGCKSVQWTRAVQTVRDGKVHPLRKRGDELDFRVETRAGLPAQTVSLEPGASDWDCDCDARTDACEHVAAAAIFLKQSLDRGEDPFTRKAVGKLAHVGYRLNSRKGPIKLRRVLVGEAGELLMPGPIAKIERKMGRDPAIPAFTIDQADRDFELRFGPATKVLIPERAMATVLEYLRKVADVQIDGREVEFGDPSAGIRLRISETREGRFVARIEQDPDITELYENGAFRRGRVLHAVGHHGLPDALFDTLRKGHVFEPRDVGVLVGQMLPEVRKHVPVTIDTPNLPGGVMMRPRVQLTTLREGDVLQVLPTIVYGDPPIARVDGERLTLLEPARRSSGAALPDLPIRDARLEKLLRQRLRDRFELEPGQRKNLGASEAIELAAALDADQKDFELDGEAHQEFFAAGALSPHLRVGEGGHFDLLFTPEDEAFDPAWFDQQDGSLDTDIHPLDSRFAGGGRRHRFRRADIAAVVRAWQAGEEFAPLLGGGFGRIPAEFMAQHGHLVADLLAAREALAAQKDPAAARASVFDLAELAAALDQAPPPEFGRLQALVGDFEHVPTAELPADLHAELRDYQRRGVDWLSFLRDAELGALLADDMGLGKTLQALCVLRTGDDPEGGKRQTLVVSPTSVLHNWRAEIEKFRPSLKASVFHGPARSFDDQADVILTTYAILRLDIDRLTERKWDTVVLDEAQAIKNPTSKVARAAYRLRARCKLALTGTPIENHLEDLWSQFHYLQPGLLGGRSEFSDRYVRAISLGDEQAAQRLRRRIRPFVLRRLKRDVAKELPPRTDVVLRCELRPDERRIYDAVRAATQAQVVEKLAGGTDVMQVLEALLRLRQAACHSALLPGGRGRAAKAGEIDRPSAKLELLLETLEEVLDEGHKALVFSQWTSLLDLVEPVLRARDIRFNRLDGTTRDRQAVVDGFQASDGPPVMLLSLKAGGTGLNLTAADNVFLLDPWWNPAVEDQAADRAHRIGQDRPVIVHRLIASDTVEDKILVLQEHKRKLAQTAVGDASGAHAITRAELLALLE